MKRVRSNFHTHTTYCDGQNTAREMVEAAIARGFVSLGFSGHSTIRHEEGLGMSPQGTAKYMHEVRTLARDYQGQIDIYLGLENDAADIQPVWGYDYVIGSVHLIPRFGHYYCVDESPAHLRHAIDTAFEGDAMRLVHAYYAEVVRNVYETRPDIVGHFDLITKFNRNHAFFDVNSYDYRVTALSALEAVVHAGCIVELNTGAMARGFADIPYPAPFLLKRLLELKAPVMINSDAHCAAHLDYGFEEAAALLYEIGFRERVTLTRDGYVEVPI